MIILHPRIYTLSPTHTTPQNPWGRVEALQIEGGQVVFAGSREEALRRRTKGERSLEVEGACVLPGLIDTHAHTTGLTMRPGTLALSDDTSPAQLALAVRDAASMRSAGSWVTGRAWNQAVWSSADLEGVKTSREGFPSHDLLSEAAPDHPVMLHRTDQHAVWVNEAAMRAAGVDSNTASPKGGEIVRAEDGSPWGVFIDEAVGLVSKALPPLSRAENQALLREKARAFLSRGVTCVHCALVRPEEFEDYRAVLGDHEDGVRFRIRGMVYADPEILAAWAGEHSPWADEGGWWSVETLKAFADGALGSRGAWFYEPYVGTSDKRGLSVATPSDIEVLGRAALAGGWQLATHAIGARAIAETVEAYARSGWTRADAQRLRWRIEHVQHPNPETLDRMAELGLYGTMQPIHATRDMRFVEAMLGPARARLSYPWRGVLDRGIPLGFGSDYPIETLDPFEGMHAAITRQDEHGHPEGGWFPEHRVGALDAVLAYTREGARLMRRDEGKLGHLGRGASADLIALDVDPSTDSPQTLRVARVLSVGVGGEAPRPVQS